MLPTQPLGLWGPSLLPSCPLLPSSQQCPWELSSYQASTHEGHHTGQMTGGNREGLLPCIAFKDASPQELQSLHSAED